MNVIGSRSFIRSEGILLCHFVLLVSNDQTEPKTVFNANVDISIAQFFKHHSVHITHNNYPLVVNFQLIN